MYSEDLHFSREDTEPRQQRRSGWPRGEGSIRSYPLRRHLLRVPPISSRPSIDRSWQRCAGV